MKKVTYVHVLSILLSCCILLLEAPIVSVAIAADNQSSATDTNTVDFDDSSVIVTLNSAYGSINGEWNTTDFTNVNAV